jgi:general secretion pathway protein M
VKLPPLKETQGRSQGSLTPPGGLAQSVRSGGNQWTQRWRAMAPRERHAAQAAAVAIGVLIVWLLLVQPALRTLRSAPALLDGLDAQLHQMQQLAAESRELRGAAPLSTAQSVAALQAATARLGERGRIVIAGDRATLTVTGATGDQLRDWFAEARSGARARPVEAQLTRAGGGYSGSIIVTLSGATS